MAASVYLIRPTDSPYFYAQWVRPDGRRSTRSLRTADPDEAERARARLEDELAQGGDAGLARIGWAEFVDRFVGERLGGASAGGRDNVRRNLGRFGRAEGPAGPRAVTADMISRHTARLRKDGLAPATVLTHLTHLGTALRWAVVMGMAQRVPHVQMVKVPRKRNIRHLRPERFPELLALCPSPPWALFCRVAWHTGMRLGELFRLRWDEGDGPWLDLAGERVRFPAEWCKSRRDDWLPLHPELLAALRAEGARAGRAFDLAPRSRELSARFIRWARPLGVGAQDLRRSFGTRYAPLVPAHVLQRLMRHADIKTTLEYYADLDPTLEAAIRLA